MKWISGICYFCLLFFSSNLSSYPCHCCPPAALRNPLTTKTHLRVSQCLCFGLWGSLAVRKRLAPVRGGWGKWSLSWGLGRLMKTALSFHWHGCVYWALLTTWRRCGSKTTLTTTWTVTSSCTSWGLSTYCVSVWWLMMSLITCFAPLHVH